MHNAPRPDFEPDELDLIGRVVRDFLATRTEGPGFEFDDLVQECAAHWWQQRKVFDERRGATLTTYLRRVARAKLRDLERDRNARKRGGGTPMLSLDVPIRPGGAGSVGDQLPDRQPVDLDWLASLDRAKDRLSERQRAIVSGLDEGSDKSELSRLLKISRDTLHRDVARIRRVFRDEGLDRYLI